MANPPKILTERGILSATKGSLLSMSWDSPVTFGTAVVSNIGLDGPTDFQHKMYGQDVSGSKHNEDFVVVSAVCIILENKSLTFSYKFQNKDDVTATFRDLLTSGM